MEVAEEEAGQIAKRQAIQMIMRDSSLTPQEKQKKIQQFMASGGQTGPSTQQTAAPPPAPAPAPVPPPPSQSASNGGGGGRQAIQAIMRDPSLTPQEKQKRIQAIMANSGPGGPGNESAPAPAPEPTPPPPPAPAPAPAQMSGGGGRQAIQEIMRDPSLTPQEKQKRIQAIMANSGPGGPSGHSTPQPEPTPPPAPAPQPAPSQAAPSGGGRLAIQAIMRDPNLTPQEKQRRVQAIMESSGPGGPSANAEPAQLPPPTQSQPPTPHPPTPATSKQELMQAVMRDTSLTPQEKQSKIQAIMAGGPPTAASAPSAQPTPTPQQSASEPPQSAMSAPSGQSQVSESRKAMMEIMQDPSLTPQEKQRRIQEIMAGGSPAPAPAPAPASTPQQSYGEPSQPAMSAPAGPPQISDSRKAMQAIMQDPNLTPQEKQRMIQEIMAGAASSPPPAARPPAASSAPGAVASTGGNQLGKSAGRAVRPMSATQPQPPSQPEPAAAQYGDSARPGASSMSRAADPAARKAPRTSGRPTQNLAGMDGPNAGPNVASAVSPVASASVRSDDPAARKMARESVRTGMSGGGEMPPTASARSDDPAARKMARESARTGMSGGGEMPPTASARSEDPAARKIARDSSRMTRSANRAAQRTATQPASMRAVSESGGTPEISQPSHDYTMIDAARKPDSGASAWSEHDAAMKSDSGASAWSEHDAARISDSGASAWSEQDAAMKSEPDRQHYAASPAYSQPNYQPDYTNDYSSSQAQMGAPSIPQAPETLSPIGESDDEAEPRVQPTSPASGSAFAGADTGGIQAYVAGQREEENAVVATGVVTEKEIEEEDKRLQTQYMWKGACLFCCLAIIIIVVVVVVTGGDDGGGDTILNVTEAPSMAPSTAPTSDNFSDLLAILRIKYGSDSAFNAVFDDESSPQYRAAIWAADEASIGLEGTDKRMLSRYALAALYFSLNGDDWTRCGRNSTNCESEREWLIAQSECAWDSVECVDPNNEDFTVREIYFRPVSFLGNNMVGTLPFDLSFLTGLERLIIAGEMLSGIIPSAIGGMTALTSLIISNNEFTGAFPEFLLNSAPNLQLLYLSGNRLTGSLPSSLSSPKLADLRLSRNRLTGPIPSSISGLASLGVLLLDDNEFSGTIPEELYELSNLRLLRLSNNTGLVGTLPEKISGLSSLEQFLLTGTGIGGTLPEGLFSLSALTSLELSRGNFTGTLSESFANLTNIEEIRLQNNTFTGTLPMAFERLRFLQELELHYNDLSGSVSEGLCNQTGPGFFDLNFLTADCAEDPPKLRCDCCTCF